MIDIEITNQEDSIEKLFCEPFEKLKPVPMTKENTGLLLKLLLGNKEYKLPEDEKPFILKVIESRAKSSFTFKLNDQRLSLFMTLLCDSPGAAVMYLTYMQYWCKKNDVKEPDIETLCEMFPYGFPSNDDLYKAWTNQKIRREGVPGSDNLLDYSKASKSIQF